MRGQTIASIKTSFGREFLYAMHIAEPKARKPMILRKRLAKVERRLAEITTRKHLANCTCSKDALIVAMPGQAKQFETEMNRTCPVHGLRRLDKIMCLRFVVSESAPESEKELVRQENDEIDQLLQIYRARLSCDNPSS